MIEDKFRAELTHEYSEIKPLLLKNKKLKTI